MPTPIPFLHLTPRHFPLLLLLIISFFAHPASARNAGMSDEAKKAFESRTWKSDAGESLPYRLLIPPAAKAHKQPTTTRADVKRMPLILFLHGAGERGKDNTAQLKWGGSLLAGDMQRQEPTVVVAPQCPPNRQWVNTPWGKGSYSTEKVVISDELRMAIEIVEQMKKDFPIDPDRVYVMGLSMGGYGAWDAIARRPDLFAAAIPICGAGDPSKSREIAKNRIAIWAFHGAADSVVPPTGSREMIDALKKADADANLTLYPGVGHDSWTHAWDEPDLLTWLFKQARQAGRQQDDPK